MIFVIMIFRLVFKITLGNVFYHLLGSNEIIDLPRKIMFNLKNKNYDFSKSKKKWGFNSENRE